MPIRGTLSFARAYLGPHSSLSARTPRSLVHFSHCHVVSGRGYTTPSSFCCSFEQRSLVSYDTRYVATLPVAIRNGQWRPPAVIIPIGIITAHDQSLDGSTITLLQVHLTS